MNGGQEGDSLTSPDLKFAQRRNEVGCYFEDGIAQNVSWNQAEET